MQPEAVNRRLAELAQRDQSAAVLLRWRLEGRLTPKARREAVERYRAALTKADGR